MESGIFSEILFREFRGDPSKLRVNQVLGEGLLAAFRTSQDHAMLIPIVLMLFQSMIDAMANYERDMDRGVRKRSNDCGQKQGACPTPVLVS
jgi:hypothetical protein